MGNLITSNSSRISETSWSNSGSSLTIFWTMLLQRREIVIHVPSACLLTMYLCIPFMLSILIWHENIMMSKHCCSNGVVVGPVSFSDSLVGLHKTSSQWELYIMGIFISLCICMMNRPFIVSQDGFQLLQSHFLIIDRFKLFALSCR